MEENTESTDAVESCGPSTGGDVKSIPSCSSKDSQVSLTMTEKPQLGMEISPEEHEFESPDTGVKEKSDTLKKALEAEKDVDSLVAGNESESLNPQSLTDKDTEREIQPALKESASSSAENDELVNQADSLQSSASKDISVTCQASAAKHQSLDELQKLSLSSVGLQSESEKKTTVESLQNPNMNSQSVLQSSNVSTDSQYFSTSGRDFSDHHSANKFRSFECEMPSKSQAASKLHQSTDTASHPEDKGETSEDSMVYANAKPDKTDSQQDLGKNQMFPENRVSRESQSLTGYLDDVITSIQTLTLNQPETEKDNVQISRAELTLMVQHTLAAQTMCNYLQDLVRENKILSQQNRALKEAVVQENKRLNQQYVALKGAAVQGDQRPQSLYTYKQSTEAQVFRFDGCSLPPHPLPDTEDQCSTSPGSHPSSQLDLNKGRGDPGREDAVSLPQTDGDAGSTSLQLTSLLSFDGDPSLRSSRDKDASTAGNIFLLQPSPAGTTDAGASVSAQGPHHLNIPDNSILYASNSIWSQQQKERMGVSARVPLEQHKQLCDELEKAKRFAYRISKEGGLHPNNCNELVSLREKVKKLQDENNALKLELGNQPRTIPQQMPPREDGRGGQLLSENDKLKIQVQQQKNLVSTLLATIDLQKQTQLKSEPPSSVGLHALPTIPSTASISCQTDDSAAWTDSKQCEDLRFQLHQAKMEVTQLQQNFQTQLAIVKKQLVQARHHEMEYGKAVEKFRSELKATNEDCMLIRQQLAEKTRHCESLGNQLTGFSQENNKLKNLNAKLEGTVRDERNRNTKVEGMLKDERRRYARDETQLLDRVKMLTYKNKEMQDHINSLRRLVIAVDIAMREGMPLTEDHAEQLAALKRRDTTPSHRVRSGIPRDGASGPSSAGTGHVQAQVLWPTSGNVAVGSKSRPFQVGGLQERGHGSQRGHNSAKVGHSSWTTSAQGSTAAGHMSLPPEFN